MHKILYCSVLDGTIEIRVSISNLLIRDPKERPNASHLLEHEFLKKYIHDGNQC